MATGKHLTDNNPDGSGVGQSATDKVGFWGATPVVQPSSANQADIISSASVSTTATTTYGYATSTQATGIVTLLRQIRSDLVTAGILKGSA